MSQSKTLPWALFGDHSLRARLLLIHADFVLPGSLGSQCVRCDLVYDP
ncbi:hypothetical protein PROFUN_08893 [Planoprotostelium fungivorum]|uniref:Uncharacterized protein n=1 Tax=Planoprotostelium fungivorum TaxID=1890364 RepID=A0A2P6NIU4_9EUKA|nr:hypothetical protein PROFUN_08893 [Planoprotostelium fungivorum]